MVTGAFRLVVGKTKFGSRIKDRINENVKRWMNGKNKLNIEVGIFDPEIAEYALKNENGVRGIRKTWQIPPRPFFRPAIEKYAPIWRTQLKESFKTTHGYNALYKQGRQMVEDIRTHIFMMSLMYALNPSTANAPSTIKRKGENRPLIDTTSMIKAVTFRKVGS